MSLLQTPLDQIRIPILRNGRVTREPLKLGQKEALEGVLRKRSGNVLPDETVDKSLFHNAPGTGKTAVFCVLAFDALERTGRPSLYSADAVATLDEAEAEYRHMFRDHFGREPIIHRYGTNGHTTDEKPDLIMGTVQFFTSHEYYYGEPHPSSAIHFGEVAADEADRWVTPVREPWLESLTYDHLMGMTGTKDRRDDPRVGYNIHRVFGPSTSEYGIEDAIANGDVNKPDYILRATNVMPLLHHILKGKIRPHEINDVYTSPELNEQYINVFAEDYQELGRPQSIIYCKTIAHARQMEEQMRQRGYDPIPIHSKIPKVQRRINETTFRQQTNGGIAICVDMWRRSVNLHDLGYILETAETKSVSKFTQTLGRAVRGKNVRVTDVTMSFPHIQHIRLYAKRLKEAYRRRRGQELEPNNLDMTGVKIHKSVDKMTQDLIRLGILGDGAEMGHDITFDEVIERSGLKDKFFFALGAHATQLWMDRRHQDPTTAIVLSTDSNIELDNEIIVKLMDPEKVNIRTWLKGLISPDGGFDLSPDQEALLAKMGIDLGEVKGALTEKRKPNIPKNQAPSREIVRELELKAEKYFESDDFWLGLQVVRETQRIIPSLNTFTEEYPFNETSHSIVPSSTPRGFAHDDGKIHATSMLEGDKRIRINMKTWFAETKALLPYASNDVRKSMFREGLVFNDPVFKEFAVRSLLAKDHAHATYFDGTNLAMPYVNIGHAEEFKVQIIRGSDPLDDGNLGTDLVQHGSYMLYTQEILRHHSLPPSHAYQTFFNIDASTEQTPLNDYVLIGLSAAMKGIHSGTFKDSRVVTLKGNDLILTSPLFPGTGQKTLREELKRIFNGVDIDSKDTLEFSIDIDQWYEDIQPYFPQLHSSVRNSIVDIISEVGIESVTPNQLESINFFESEEFWIGLEAFRTLRSQTQNFDLLIPIESMESIRLPNVQIADAHVTIAHSFAADVDESTSKTSYTGTVDLQAWYKKAQKLFPAASMRTQLGLFDEGIVFNSPIIREIIARAYPNFPPNDNRNPIKPVSAFAHPKNEETGYEVTSHGIVHIEPERYIDPNAETMMLTTPASMKLIDILRYQAYPPSPEVHRFVIGGEYVPKSPEQRAEIFAASDYFSLGMAAHRTMSRDVRIYNPNGRSRLQIDISKVPRFLFTEGHDTDDFFYLPGTVTFDLGQFYKDLAEHRNHFSEEIRKGVDFVIPPQHPKSSRPIVPSMDPRVARNAGETDRDHFLLHRTIFREWMNESECDFSATEIPISTVQKAWGLRGLAAYNSLEIEEASLSSLRICQQLAYRTAYLATTGDPIVSNPELETHLVALKESGYFEKKTIDGLGISLRETQEADKALDYAGLQVLASIPPNRFAAFFEGMLAKDMSRKILGQVGFVPTFDVETHILPYEATGLLIAHVEQFDHVQSALVACGFSLPDKTKGGKPRIIPKGTSVISSEGETLHLAEDTGIDGGNYDDFFWEFVEEHPFPGLTRSEAHLWKTFDDAGVTLFINDNLPLALNLHVFEEWLNWPGRQTRISHGGMPERFIVPAGTQIQLAPERVLTLPVPYLCPDAINICRTLLYKHMVGVSPSWRNEQFESGYSTRNTTKAPILNVVGLDWDLNHRDEDQKVYDAVGPIIKNLVGEPNITEFLSALTNQRENPNALPHEPDIEKAVINFEKQCVSPAYIQLHGDGLPHIELIADTDHLGDLIRSQIR